MLCKNRRPWEYAEGICCIFRPVFGCCTPQMLVEIYNRYPVWNKRLLIYFTCKIGLTPGLCGDLNLGPPVCNISPSVLATTPCCTYIFCLVANVSEKCLLQICCGRDTCNFLQICNFGLISPHKTSFLYWLV